MATPDFVLDSEYRYSISMHDSYTLPAGTFVRPIKLCYVPKHVLERKSYSEFDPTTEVYCFTPKGILNLPVKIIYQTGGSRALDISTYLV